MGICYSDEKSSGASNVPYERWNATKHYITHYGNLLLLKFLANNSKDGAEKHQAAKEVLIAERKLAFWMRHPAWRKDEAIAAVVALKKQWKIAT